MPPLLVLVASLVLNYVRHRQNKSTMCSFTRERVSVPVAASALIAFLSWFVPHWFGPKIRKEY